MFEKIHNNCYEKNKRKITKKSFLLFIYALLNLKGRKKSNLDFKIKNRAKVIKYIRG